MDATRPSLSVVIPAFDAAETIGQQLDALRVQRTAAPVEIVVVDNASTDSTDDVVRGRAALDDRVRIVSEPVRGAASALNRGIADARADRLAFCDADDVVSEGWVEAALRALDDHRLVTGPLELDRLNDPATARSRGGSWANRLSSIAGVFPLVPSGNFAARREALEAVGGFDAGIRIGYDVDFSYRAFESGITVGFDPNLIVHYRYRDSLHSQWAQGRAMGRFRPGLYRRLRHDGHGGPGRLDGVRRWLWLARSIPILRRRSGRMRWVWVAANQVGQLEGSLRARSLFL